MDEPELFPPKARRSDPDTSVAAADSVKRTTVERQRTRIVALLDVRGPCTDEELASWYIHHWDDDFTPSGLRTRRSELVKLRRVEWTGEKRRISTGRLARVWRLRPNVRVE